MIDFGHLPKPQNGTIDYFPGFSNTDGGSWEVWNKPKNCMFIRILCIGGASGGASGFPSATTNARGGGGGGGSSAYGYVTIPAGFLPDRLYVSAGVGGKGGASSTSISNPGSNGILTYVSIAPSSTAIYVVCGAGRVNGGNAATALSAGSGGSTGISISQSSALQGFQGHYTNISTSGVSGAGGGVHTGAVGSSITYPTTGLLLSGGAGGGGGAGFAGGNVTQPASQDATLTLFQTLIGGVAGTVGSTVGGNGIDGVELYQPLLATGGSGGGSSFDGTAKGGDGGDGGFGSGGGGGGAGGTDGGGAGGNGGPGLVVIHTW